MMLARLSFTVMVLIGAVLMNFSPGDMAGLAESNRQGKIRVAVDPHLPPFQFMDEGTLTGFNIDILEKVAEYQQLEVEYVPLNLEQSVDALANGEVDVILGIHFSADYAERMEFSDRFFTSSVGVLVPAHEDHIKGLADLSNRIVALQRGTVEYDFLRNIRRVKYHVTSSQAQAFELLQRGRAEVFVGNRHTAEYLLQEYGVANQYQFADGYLLPLEYSLAVPGGRYQLLHTLNRGLRTVVHEGDYTQIYNHWFGQDPALVAQRLRTAITVIVSLFAIALMMMVYGMYWNRKLQQEVDNKTKDLQEANRSLAYQIEETKNSQQFKEQILDSSPRGIVTCDRHGLITSFNPKALEIVGVEEKPLGRHYSHIPLISALFKGKISQVLAQGQQFLGEEYDWAPDGQTTYHLRYYVYPLYDYEKHVTGVILSFEDVTEEYRLREQLFTQEKNRALGQLVAGIAHEIRNPLTSIKTFAELIPSKFENAVFRQEMATHVPKEIERLNQLIGGLIDYAKPRRAKKEPVYVQSLIEAVLILFQPSVEKKGFRVRTNLERDLSINVDAQQMKQVLINLILNAIEAMEIKRNKAVDAQAEGLTLHVSAWADETDVYIAIKDEGIGMSMEELNKAFEPFYTTKPKGTGLGLSLSQQYVAENNGRLVAESTPGQGTVITLIFNKERDANGQDTGNR